MRSFNLLSVVLVAVLVVLQWGGESNAILPTAPAAPYYPPKSYSYQQPQVQPYYSYAPPAYIPSALPREYEGLYDKSTIAGNDNIDFTGFDILGNVNLPANALSITDVLDGLGGLGR